MQNQNMQPWAWSQSGASAFPAGPVFPSAFSPAAVDQNQLMSGYQQMYGAAPSQPPPDYGASQWSAAQIQHWQQWQQWQEKYQQWQAQYGKKYAESIAAMGQNPNLLLPGVPSLPGVAKPNEVVPNPGYTTANPPPPPSNAQPVPPPPPEEDKAPPGSAGAKGDRGDGKSNGSDLSKENPEELSEAEKTFDIQFKQWEDQFNEWKKQNQDHPDKAQYREYEKKWETWREQLLQRREQMRKKRLSKTIDGGSETGNSAKGEDSKGKSQQEQTAASAKGSVESEGASDVGVGVEAQGTGAETKPAAMSYATQEAAAVYPYQKPVQDAVATNQAMGGMNAVAGFGAFPGAEAAFPGMHDGQMMARSQGYYERQSPTFAAQAAASAFDANAQKYRAGLVDGGGVGSVIREKEFAARFLNADNQRSDGFAQQRRQFGNGSFDEERTFPGGRYGNFDGRKGQDRFVESRMRADAKFGSGVGRAEFAAAAAASLNDQAFCQGGRTGGQEGKSGAFNSGKNAVNSSFLAKPKVPSLFDITVEKPPGLASPGKERKGKMWDKYDKDGYFEDSFDEKKEDKGGQRNEKPWLPNAAWAKNNSPWIKPWELDRVHAEKPPDANLRPDAWQKDPMSGGGRCDEKPWTGKPELDKSELSGYVGNILAKLGNFNALPPSLPQKDSPFIGDATLQNPSKMMHEPADKLPFDQGHAWPSRGEFGGASGKPDHPNPGVFSSQDGLPTQNTFGMHQGNFVREGQAEPGNPGRNAQGLLPPNAPDHLVLFGKGDCDDRFRFDRDRSGYGRDGRGSFGREDRIFLDERGGFRREDRGVPFQDEPTRGGQLPGSRGALARDEDRFFARNDRNSFGRDDRGGPGGRFGPLDDVDDRIGRSRDRSERRGFEDRDDRVFRGGYDRDDRRGRGFGSPFDRNFGRNLDGSGPKEPEWNPQVFDYSKGSQQGFRSRFSDAKDNFQISTVVDYSHGESKQTFDYGHGEGKSEGLEVKSFDYGHSRESPAVIDYGHGNEKDSSSLQQWKKEGEQQKGGIDQGGRSDHSKSRSPSRRSRSPRGLGRPRSRSRSPRSCSRGGAARRGSDSPTFRAHRSRSRDRFGRQMMKRNRRNSSEDKSLQGADGEVAKSNFDVTTVLVEDLICTPGRDTRPNKLVFIIRGLPGSGKTYVTKLIKDKEVEMGGDPPRILSLDDYFMTEVEKEVVDEESGRKVKKKVLEYEYESGAEPHYRGSLLKAFKKTISDGFFAFIIVDSVNEKTKDYEEMWSFAKQKGFQVYVAEMDNDVALCTKRNVHKRTEKEISDLSRTWEETPTHYLRLDVRSFLQADAITEVEMEVVSDTDNEKGGASAPAAAADKSKPEEEEEEEEEKEDEEEDEQGESTFVKSRWDHFENSEQKLDRLDGLKRRREGFHTTMEDYLQLPDEFDVGANESSDGKKKVRWADLEERRQQEKMRAIGFVVGQTDWSRMTDPTFGESALTRTKYI